MSMKNWYGLPLLIFCLAWAWPIAASGGGWEASIAGHAGCPEHFVAIDKDSQTLFMLSRLSPVRVTRKLPCTTGQVPGDKLQQGDLKTPEGVYFVTRKRSGGLDYELYGDVAYPLNFPNPVDKIKGKTGTGIWIHGRGRPIEPRETRGCVALNMPDIASLERSLPVGTPVVIAKRVTIDEHSAEVPSEAGDLAGLVHAWAGDWRAKSDGFFSHYAPEMFDRAENMSFSDFKEHKRSIFASQPWIDVYVSKVRALRGPDYWVTYFGQFYRTRDMASQVSKRLYWMRDKAGQWKIVGREYAGSGPDLTDEYLAHRLEAVNRLVADWAEDWRRADLHAYLGHYAPSAGQDERRGVQAIAEQKRLLWEKSPPARIELGRISLAMDPDGLRATFKQHYVAENGYSDTGLKTLVLAPDPEGLRIVSETWSPAK